MSGSGYVDRGVVDGDPPPDAVGHLVDDVGTPISWTISRSGDRCDRPPEAEVIGLGGARGGALDSAVDPRARSTA
jgi:hypothetical protein